MRADVILWDVDGTVLNFLASEKAAIRACFAEFGLGECSDGMISVYSKINIGYWEKLERGEHDKPYILTARFRDFFSLYSIDTEIAPAFNRMYQYKLGDTVCFQEHALDVLTSLKGRIPQFAVTNGTAVAQNRKLAASGLDAIFDGIFISETVGYEKPDTRFFDAVLQAVPGIPRNRVCIVGDSLTSDMRGGADSGLVTVWYNPNGKPRPDGAAPRIDVEIRDLSRFPEWLTSDEGPEPTDAG